MKKFIQKILNFLGYKVTKIQTVECTDLDEITKLIIRKPEPVVFDVGANVGQSIERYKKIFQKPTIHSFDPNPDLTNSLSKIYQNDKNVIINNLGVGEKEENLEFNIYVRNGNSSYKEIVPNTTWLKIRSKTAGVDTKDYKSKKINTKVITLDDYAKKNNIENIDILKIDTQGFEDKVLLGAKNLIKENRIKLIQVELIFSEIYESPLQIYDVEKTLIPNNYKLFGTSNGGSLISYFIYQSDYIYISQDTYEDFKLSSHYIFHNK
jgi:FkbM family methyltransferase